MKFEDFKIYKELAESNYNGPEKNPEVQLIREFLEYKEEVLNEGIWQNVWNWIKRNLTPTAMKLNHYASEYAKELEEELRAEYEKAEDSKSLAAKMRTSYGARLSGEIEEKMKLVADNDSVYTELIHALITNKNYEVKKKLLEEYRDKFNSEDYREMSSNFDNKQKKSKVDLEKAYEPLISGGNETYKGVYFEFLKKLEEHDFSDVFKTKKEKEDVAAAITLYCQRLSKHENSEFDVKHCYKIAKQYLVIFEKLKHKYKDYRNIREEIKDSVNKFIHDESAKGNPEPLDDSAKNSIEKILKQSLNDQDTDLDFVIPDEVLSDETEEVLDKKEIEKAVEIAGKDTDKKEPSEKEITKEMIDSVKEFFSTNKKSFFHDINNSIEKFNKSSDKESIAKENFYKVDNNGKLPVLNTPDEVGKLMTLFVDTFGIVYPFFQIDVKHGKRTAEYILKRNLFELYAISLMEDDIKQKALDKLVEKIKKISDEKHS